MNWKVISKHRPTPWVAIGGSVETEDGRIVADADVDSHDDDLRIAIAQLTAAGPELLEGLRPFVRLWDTVEKMLLAAGLELTDTMTLSAKVLARTPGFAFKVRHFRAARAAIAKAEKWEA